MKYLVTLVISFFINSSALADLTVLISAGSESNAISIQNTSHQSVKLERNGSAYKLGSMSGFFIPCQEYEELRIAIIEGAYQEHFVQCGSFMTLGEAD